MKSLEIVFAGTPAFALPALNAIKQSHHKIKAVYTQPDRPKGRGRKLQKSPVKIWAEENNIQLFQPVNFKDEQSIETFKNLNPDVLVVIAYGLILPDKILNIPHFGCINVHASLLPKWRGASPIQHAILYGDEQTGVTIMQMDSGMDTGDIILSAKCTINVNDTTNSLHDKLANLAINPLIATLDDLAIHSKINKIPQPQNATYAPKIKKEDARINWHQNALDIYNVIRAYNPWPVAFTQFNEFIIKIHQAKIIDKTSKKNPGTIIEINKDGIQVTTKDNILVIERLQFPSGKILSIAEWLNSNQNQLYENFEFT